MTRRITATEANQRFPELLRRVQAGEQFTVTSRGRPVALVSPVPSATKQRTTEDFLAFLRALPERDPMPWTREDLYD